MAVDINELLKPLDKAEVAADVMDFAASFGLTTTAWQPGEPAPVLVDKIVGFLVDDIWNGFALPALRAQFLEKAAGAWLTIKAKNDHDVDRIGELSATGQLVIENRGAGFGTIAAGQIRVKHATSGKTYTNTTAGTITAWAGAPAAYPTVTLTFEADEVGTKSNALAGTISTSLVSSPFVGLYGQPNASPWLGSDEEGDASLLSRARLAITELSPSSPRGAYESAAKAPLATMRRHGLPVPAAWGTAEPSIARVRVVEPGNAVINVYCAALHGTAAGDSVTDGTDVYKANVAIQACIVPPGFACGVNPATEKIVSLGMIVLYVDAGANVTAAEADAAARAALTAFDAALPIGGARTTPGGTGYVYANKVRGVLEAPAYVINATLSFSDTALADNEVAVLTYSIAVNIVEQN